jgi:acyl dehydratase
VIGFFEDVTVGEKTRLGSHTFTREEIVGFAAEWDPQPFHLDEEAGRASIFGSLCASGWHTACVAMRLMVDARAALRDAQQARGEPIPRLGVSPGVSKLRWLIPTQPGDTLTYYREVLGKRETRQPQWGLVHTRAWAVNQNGHEALSFESSVFIERRPR